MGYIFNFNDAKAYEEWYKYPRNKAVADIETKLMFNMLKPKKGETIIDIGCGTGTTLSSLLDKGLNPSGIDPSPYMLDIAKEKLKNRVDLHRGFAEDLPFDDNSFNHACLITSLEFMENPEKALKEACRVAKDRLFIGVLNSYAIKGIERRVKGIFSNSIYNQAKFFSIWELKQILGTILGDVPITWRTISQSPSSSLLSDSGLEQLNFVQRSPFGAYVGMVAELVPRFRTKPLNLKFKYRIPTVQTSAAPA